MRTETPGAKQSARLAFSSSGYLLGVSLLFLLAARPAFPQEQINGVVAGRVTNSRGQPQSVLVSLIAPGEVLVQQAYTDSNGNFTFSDLRSGVYYVSVEASGYQPARQAVSIDARTSSRTQVNVFLEAIESTPKSPSPIISGGVSSHKLDLKKSGRSFDAKALREFDKANQKQQAGDLEGAFSHYQKAIRIEPDFYPALNNLGVLSLKRKDPAQAEMFFLKSLAANPDDGEAYINLGHVLYEEAKYEPAIARLEEGIKRSPESSAGYFFRGSAYLKLGDLEKAEKDLKTACTLDAAGMVPAHLQLANVYLRQHDMNAASSELRTYLQAAPTAPQAPAIKKMLANIAAGQTN